jgi:NADH-quinone oxidoreductase subunit M
MDAFPILSILTAIPLIGGFVLMAWRSATAEEARGAAITLSAIPLFLAVLLWQNFDPGTGDLQFVERHLWIPTLGIEYFVGIDGLSILMVLLCAIVVPMSIWASGLVRKNGSLHFGLVLLLQGGLFGTFTALSFFHWFIFWELSLLPAFFLIKFWGGPDRSRSATQFFIYTMVGSIGLLLAFMAMAMATGSFDFKVLAELGRSGELTAKLGETVSVWGLSGGQVTMMVFLGVFLGVAVKVPLFPFHTWLPSAYAEATSPTTMLLTGLMSKMGVYGFLRILLPIFPAQMAVMSTGLLWLAVLTIVASAFAAFAQRDLKRMFAYSSINHLGYCLLGIFAVGAGGGSGAAWGVEQAAALNGVLLQMFNHGLTAAALFCFVRFLEDRSGGLRGLGDFGGLRRIAPVFCGLMGISVFASLGLPGLNGFAGEFLIFKGVFSLAGWAAMLSTVGLLVTAVFLLTLLQRVFHGPLNERWAVLPDLSFRERLIVLPATVLMFLLGIYPQLAVGLVNQTVVEMVRQIQP